MNTHFFQSRLNPKAGIFEAQDSLSLLEVAQFADITLPSSCRNGTCRTCMCRLISGQVKYVIEWPGLSAEEKKADGYILPCVAYPQSDVIIDVPGATRRRSPT
ncbi:2Fe-2S iron-sulfur cluster-binding protein [Undibacterium arcticum]